jgi:ATP-dependent protease HslVU (ClpYQ) peptidase subunit
MTVIVGVVDNDRVILGGDSAGIAGNSLSLRSDPKVFYNGPFVIGVAGSFRMGQILRHHLSLTEPELPPGLPVTEAMDHWMATTFINKVSKAFKKGGWEFNSEEGVAENFLIAWRDHLYLIDSDFQYGRHHGGYWAIGCGDDFALGSLYTTDGLPSEDRVEWALKAAAHHSTGVAGPFHILSTEPIVNSEAGNEPHVTEETSEIRLDKVA